MQSDMHYGFVGAAVAESHRFGPGIAGWVALYGQLVDEATQEAVELPDVGEQRPVTTQATIEDGVYVTLRHLSDGGWDDRLDKVIEHHFPPVERHTMGPCAEPRWDGVRIAADTLARVLASKPHTLYPVLCACADLGRETHTALDRVSHQGFAGFPWEGNGRPRLDCGFWAGLLSGLLPDRLAIGHAEYGTDPDAFGRKWKRYGKTIDNRVRFARAAAELWNAICPTRFADPDEVALVAAGKALISTGWPACVRAVVECRSSSSLRGRCIGIYVTHEGEPMPTFEMPPRDGMAWRAFCRVVRERHVGGYNA